MGRISKKTTSFNNQKKTFFSNQTHFFAIKKILNALTAAFSEKRVYQKEHAVHAHGHGLITRAVAAGLLFCDGLGVYTA